jgi:hypothetical protein
MSQGTSELDSSSSLLEQPEKATDIVNANISAARSALNLE